MGSDLPDETGRFRLGRSEHLETDENALIDNV